MVTAGPCLLCWPGRRLVPRVGGPVLPCVLGAVCCAPLAVPSVMYPLAAWSCVGGTGTEPAANSLRDHGIAVRIPRQPCSNARMSHMPTTHLTHACMHTQEDAHVVNLDIDGHGTALFAVFDGHSGREVSAFCAQHFVSSGASAALELESRVHTYHMRHMLLTATERNTQGSISTHPRNCHHVRLAPPAQLTCGTTTPCGVTHASARLTPGLQVEELLAAPSFRQGDVGGGLRDAFLALDRRMADQDSRAELAAYAKGCVGTLGTDGRGQGLAVCTAGRTGPWTRKGGQAGPS